MALLLLGYRFHIGHLVRNCQGLAIALQDPTMVRRGAQAAGLADSGLQSDLFMKRHCSRNGAIGMEELVQRVSAATGLEPETSHKAIGIVLNFLQKQTTPEQSAAVLDQVPGAREAAAAAASEEEGGGVVSGLMSTRGAGLMGLANQLSSAGLGMSQMQSLGREMFAYLRQHAGEDAVGELGASIPGLHQFM